MKPIQAIGQKVKNLAAKTKTWFLGLSKTKKLVYILVLVLLVTGTGASAWFFGRISDMDRMFPGIDFEDPNDDPDIKDVRDAFNNKTLNILLMGYDSNEARVELDRDYRADTLMVGAINLETGKIDIISIPRDTLVPIYNRGGGKDKVNSAYSYGYYYGGAPSNDQEARHQMGIKYQIETVSIALKGIPIHYYVAVDMDAVVEIVDIMGGVWYDIDHTVYHNSGRVIAEPGYQKLSGKKFLEFIRSRQYRDGDLQRVRNQQEVLIAAFDQFKKANKLINAPQVMMSVRNNVETNLSVEQIMSLAWFGTQKVDTKNISNHTLQTSFAYGRLQESWTRSYSYLIINQQKRAELIYDIWGIQVSVDPTDTVYPPLSDEEPGEDSDEDPWIPVDGGQDPGDGDKPDEGQIPDPADPGQSGPGEEPGDDPDPDPGDPEDPDETDPDDQDENPEDQDDESDQDNDN